VGFAATLEIERGLDVLLATRELVRRLQMLLIPE
jgi:hypothetical protein